MSAAFFGHGSPANVFARNSYTEAWRRFAARIPRPRAVLAISAHWYVPGVRITVASQPRTIHDFNARFDAALFAFRYPAPGSPALADRVAALLAPEPVARDDAWGFDHGAYGVLAHLFPDASVPVVELALDRTKSAEEHYRLACRLRPLRDEGVLVLGSGNVVHNLELAEPGSDGAPFPWALHREARVCELARAGDDARLVAYRSDGDDARLAVPTPEHYLPLLYVLAQRRPDDACETFARGIVGGSIGMASLALGRR